MRFLNTILDFVFPPKCALCKETGVELCLKCIKNAPEADRESANWIFPIFDYRHEGIKKALWLLKYRGKKRLAQVFAEMLYEKMVEEFSELSVLENFVSPILIPIPLSPKRQRERGFNQSVLLCEALLQIDRERKQVNFSLEDDVLTKPRETKHQAHIKDRKQRLQNISGSFAVQKSENVKNKNIILIDDILTTGATLTEARRVLEKVGAKKIIAFTVAH